ncbi:MAG: ABC transporter ATP-binding protein [Chloroflexi bacterium]|nr:ABC transporter ATP-binding protein [Chloroflexota bacterium]
MNAVEFHNVSKRYGRNTVIDSLNMAVEADSFTVIFGAPASGKSTLLRLLTGLEKPDNGHIIMRGEDVTAYSPAKRNIGYVPQSFALYPHYQVFDNIAYPLKLMGYSRQQVAPLVESTADRLKISHLLQKKPNQLSGGEKQRVAIARGIMKNTNIFVLDDPLTGLDFKLREQLFDDMREMQASLDATFIYTTSDALEVLMLAENVNILDAGKIIEAGAQEAIYSRPDHVRTMSLLGFPEANLLPGQIDHDSGQPCCQTKLFTFPVTLNQRANGHAQVRVGLRPQDIKIAPAADADLMVCDADITLVEDLGGELVIYLETNGEALTAMVSYAAGRALTEGHTRIGVHPSRFLLYADADGHNIGQGTVTNG